MKKSFLRRLASDRDWLGSRWPRLYGSAPMVVWKTLPTEVYRFLVLTVPRGLAKRCISSSSTRRRFCCCLRGGLALCANCRNTARLVEEVAVALGVPVQIEKIEDMTSIAKYGVMSTPGVVVDGKVVHAGGVPDRKKVESWFV